MAADDSAAAAAGKVNASAHQYVTLIGMYVLCGDRVLFFDERREHDSLKPTIWRRIGGQHILRLRYDSCGSGSTLMSLAFANLNPEQLRAVKYGGLNYADCGPLLIIVQPWLM